METGPPGHLLLPCLLHKGRWECLARVLVEHLVIPRVHLQVLILVVHAPLINMTFHLYRRWDTG